MIQNINLDSQRIENNKCLLLQEMHWPRQPDASPLRIHLRRWFRKRTDSFIPFDRESNEKRNGLRAS